MTALYNENDPFAADWLESLITHGHIVQGRVDRRSIADLVPADVTGPGQRHFFAGIGGWSYALRLAGIPDDADVWTGSCPCQPFSDAGQGQGVLDPRHLWPAWFALIEECRPPIIFGEQVASKDGLGWLDVVFADLERCGYTVGAADLCAAGVGAPHARQRLYFVAYAPGERLEGLRPEEHGQDSGVAHARRARSRDRAAARGDDEGERSEGSVDAPRSGGAGVMADAQGLGRCQGRQAAGRDRPGPSDHRAPRIVGDTSCAGSGRDSGAVPGTQAQDQGVRDSHRQLCDLAIPAGATGGFWADAEWILCRDPSGGPPVARPVEPVVVKMVDGLSDDMGNRPHEETLTDEDVPQLFADADEEAIPRRAFGAERMLRSPRVLRPLLHGGVDGGPDQDHQPEEWPSPISEGGQAGLREVWSIEFSSLRPSSGRGSHQQRSREPADIMRLLSSSYAFAKRRSDDRTTATLLALLSSFGAERLVLDPPLTQEAIWRSIGEEAQDRIRLGLDLFTLTHIPPLLKRRMAGRVGLLRGYGNAIVPQVAAAFIRSAREAIADNLP